MGKIYSEYINTPNVKPPRFDLRHRTKENHETVDSPKEPELDLTPSWSVDGYELNDFLLESFTSNNMELQPKEQPKIIETKPLIKKKSNDKQVQVKFKAKDWVFTQSTAVCSVNLCKDKFHEHQITTDTIKYVNNNGNSWETSYLGKVYKTMIGAKNLKDHIDTNEGGKIYGIIIDAIPRKVKTPQSGFIYYIDILIATSRKIDAEWANAIETGKVRYMSIGFECDFLVCTRCGHIYSIDGTGICTHCAFELNLKYYDIKGRLSKVSAMATTNGGIGKGFFSEVSYLSVNPAFEGAIQSHTLKTDKNSEIIVNMPELALRRPAMKFFKNYWELVK